MIIYTNALVSALEYEESATKTGSIHKWDIFYTKGLTLTELMLFRKLERERKNRRI